MSNMGYCRYQNTFKDLQDCYECDDKDMSEIDHLSEDETKAREKLVSLCIDIAQDFGELGYYVTLDRDED